MTHFTDSELSQGTFRCDICGLDTPHSHDAEYVETERYVRPAFEKTTVPRGWFHRWPAHGPYGDRNTEALWQHFLTGWFASKAHYRQMVTDSELEAHDKLVQAAALEEAANHRPMIAMQNNLYDSGNSVWVYCSCGFNKNPDRYSIDSREWSAHIRALVVHRCRA